MAERTLVENVAQVKADFKAVKDAVGIVIPEGTPTSEYGERIFNTISSLEYEIENSRTEGIEQGKQEVISNSKYIERQASGKLIRLDDVSEVAHKVVVKADEPTEVKVCGKNLFKNDISLMKELSYINSSGGTNKRNGYEIHLPVGTYTATLILAEGATDVYWYGFVRDVNGNNVGTASLNQSTSNRTPLSFTINEGDTLLWYDGFAGRTIQQSWDLCLGLCQVQLEAGYIATPYEEYKEPQTITATPSGTEVSSICPTMTFVADSDISVDYFGSYGMQTEYDRFWDRFQENGKRTGYAYGFSGQGWNDYTFKPKYDVYMMNYMFYDSRITDLSKSLAEQGVRLIRRNKATENLTYAFALGRFIRLPELDFSNVTNTTATFYNSANSITLQSIEKIISNEVTIFANNCFNNCGALEHCIFEGTIASDINLQWSPKLDLESLISLFLHLKNFIIFDRDNAFTKTVILSAESWELTNTEEFAFAIGVNGRQHLADLGWNWA